MPNMANMSNMQDNMANFMQMSQQNPFMANIMMMNLYMQQQQMMMMKDPKITFMGGLSTPTSPVTPLATHAAPSPRALFDTGLDNDSSQDNSMSAVDQVEVLQNALQNREEQKHELKEEKEPSAKAKCKAKAKAKAKASTKAKAKAETKAKAKAETKAKAKAKAKSGAPLVMTRNAVHSRAYKAALLRHLKTLPEDEAKEKARADAQSALKDAGFPVKEGKH
eukprot:Skav234069  [mRNA]  locus=scaffold2565:15142:15807:+ [translate_table: standard]